MLAETKAYLIHFGARNIIERIIKPINYDLRKGATLESARLLDTKEGNFQESANHYYTVNLTSEDIDIQAKAVIGLSQELINLGSFRQVRELLQTNQFRLINRLSETKWLLFKARVNEKLGWVEDYEFGYFESRQLFTQVGELLNGIPNNLWGEEEKETYSTTRHFLGRAAFGLASLGIDRRRNILRAVRNFKEATLLDKQLEVDTIDAKIGHGYAWRARCLLALGDLTRADYLIKESGEHFQKHDEKFPNKGVMTHYEVVSGLRDLQAGLVQDARDHFQSAVDIRENTGGKNYQKGLADAYVGIAATYLRERDLFTAFKYLKIAARANYYVVLRGFVGG